MELTKEYFDKALENLSEKMVTKDYFDKVIDKMATKEALKAQTIELKQYVAESFETQQVWIDSRFEELIEKYDVRERVHQLEKNVAKLKLVRS